MRPEAIEIVARQQLKVYAEVGIGRGDTTHKVAAGMVDGGTIHLFDYEENVKSVAEGIRKTHGSRLRVVEHPSSKRMFDSYNWPLMKIVRDSPEKHRLDFVYLDGAHIWQVDALAFVLLDKLLVPGGFIEFDDYSWSHMGSMAEKHRLKQPAEKIAAIMDYCYSRYTAEQITVAHIEQVVEILVRPREDYKEVAQNRLFQKAPWSEELLLAENNEIPDLRTPENDDNIAQP